MGMGGHLFMAVFSLGNYVPVFGLANCNVTRDVGLGVGEAYPPIGMMDVDISESNMASQAPGSEGLWPVLVNILQTGAPSGKVYVPPSTVYRLREGIERFFITDINNPAGSAAAQSSIPIMWDNFMSTTWNEDADDGPTVYIPPSAFNHVPGGGNVLFLDGHVSFQRTGTAYPYLDMAPNTGDDFGPALGEWMTMFTYTSPEWDDN